MKKFFLLPLNFKNKTGFLFEKIKEVNLTNNFIYITSSFCKVQDFKSKFYGYFKNPSIPPSFTLKSLALKIIEERSSKRIISEIEKYLILLEIIKKEKNNIISYTDEGFARIVLNFIKELKVSSISEIDIPKIRKLIFEYPWRFEETKKNVNFALTIFEKYEKYLRKNNLIDFEDIYKEATEYLEKKDFKNIVFENIFEIPEYQKKFISTLINMSENTFIFYFEPSLFSPDTQELIIKDTLEFFYKIEKWEKEEIKGETFDTILECFNFPTMEEEVKGIIELISEEIEKDNSLTLNEFIITCPDILSYRNYIKRIFLRFKIPVEIIPGYTLIKDPSISSIFEFLSFSNTYDWGNLINILSSPYFTKFNSEEIKKISELTRKCYENTGFYKENFDKLNGENIKIIKKCLNLIKKNKMTLNEWRKSIKGIIKETNWYPPEYEIKVEFEKLLEELKGSYYLTKESFINLVNKLLELIEVEEGKGNGIRVSGVIESLGIEKKICFFCGTTEKNFPNAPKIEEFFLPDSLKREIGLDYFEKRVARDRGDFYRIKGEHEKVIFTYPSKVGDELQIKSIFIFDIPVKEYNKQQFYIVSKELFKVEINIEKFEKKYFKNGKLEINVTDLEMFLKCPYKFYLKNLEKIEPYKVPTIKEVPALWGNIIHESFKNTFENEKNLPIEGERLKEYREKFEYHINREIEKKIKEKKFSNIYSKILKLRCNEVINKFENVIKNHIGNIFIGFEEEIKTENSKFKLKGKADIIEKIKDNNKIAIIDIKTGTSQYLSYTEENFFKNYNVQLPLYIWIYAKENNLPFENIKGIIWNFTFFEDEKKIEKVFDFTKSSRYNYRYLEKIEDFLNQIVIKIMNREITFIPNFEKCEYICEYKEMCIYGK